ncbi:hypothetical protein KC331_g15024 [Hortaea werneckii]|nr:hypothetical protein KC331_g15024 [Hortaea werneckii]KAI7704178.1 hypothetical protein KC353_g13623 [Hortaea werneckii]
MARKKTKPKRYFRNTPGPLSLDAIHEVFDSSPLDQYLERMKRLQREPLVDMDRSLWKDQNFPAKRQGGDGSRRWDAMQQRALNLQRVFDLQSSLLSLPTSRAIERQLPIRSTQVSQPAPPLDHFPFMDLPPELRKMVLQLTLQEGEPIGIRSHKPSSLNPDLRFPIRLTLMTSAFAGLRWNPIANRWTRIPSNNIPSLMRVSKQIREESAPIVYGDHVFHFRWMDDCNIFLHHIGKEMRFYLRRLYIDDFHLVRARQAFHLLLDARDLQSLEFGPRPVLKLVGCVYLTGDEMVLSWIAQAAKPLLQSMQAELNHDDDGGSRRRRRATTDPLSLIRFHKRAKCENCAKGMERGKCTQSLSGFLEGMRNTCADEEIQVRLIELGVRVATRCIMRERVDVGVD